MTGYLSHLCDHSGAGIARRRLPVVLIALTVALLAQAAAAQAATISFTKLGTAAGASPVSVATGDFNFDGRPDVAIANFNPGTVTVLLGAGNGTFTPAS